MNHLKLTSDKLELNEINDLVTHETCGAISFFIGTTRDNFEDKTVGRQLLSLITKKVQLIIMHAIGLEMLSFRWFLWSTRHMNQWHLSH